MHLEPLPVNLRYLNFIEDRGLEDERNRHQDDEVKERTESRANFARTLRIREDEVQALDTVLIDAYHRVQENRRKCSQAVDEFHQRYGVNRAVQMPTPPEIQALYDYQRTIIEETIASLKTALGHETFERFDTWLARYEGKVWVPGPDPLNPSPAPDQAPDKPAN